MQSNDMACPSPLLYAGLMNMFFRTGAILSVAMLLSGCIRIDITQTVDTTGGAQVELLYDLTKFAEMSKDSKESDGKNTDGALSIGMYGPSSSSASSAGTDVMGCSQFKERQTDEPPVPLTNILCVDKAPNVFMLTGTQKLRHSEFTRRRSGKKTVYLYKIQNANKLIQSQQKGVESDPSISKDSGQFDSELMNSILQGTFTVIMPGHITKSPGGVVAGNRVTFKFTDFPLKRGGVIQSEE